MDESICGDFSKMVKGEDSIPEYRQINTVAGRWCYGGNTKLLNTGGFNNWQTATLSGVGLTAGDHIFRFLFNTGNAGNTDFGFDINWFNFDLAPLPLTVTRVPVTDAAVPKETIETIKKDLTLSVFPNPAESYFNLKVQGKSMEPVTIRITDIAGRQVQQLQGMPGQAVRFGDRLVQGTYFVEVRQGSQRVVRL